MHLLSHPFDQIWWPRCFITWSNQGRLINQTTLVVPLIFVWSLAQLGLLGWTLDFLFCVD
jgi:hypothetical protein